MPAGHDISFARFPPVLYTDENSFVMEDTGLFTQFFRLLVSGSSRANIRGTARLTISDALSDPSVLRARAPGSVSVNSDEYAIEVNRVIFAGNARKTLNGTGRAQLTDYKPIGRLVLSGSGGGS